MMPKISVITKRIRECDRGLVAGRAKPGPQ